MRFQDCVTYSKDLIILDFIIKTRRHLWIFIAIIIFRSFNVGISHDLSAILDNFYYSRFRHSTVVRLESLVALKELSTVMVNIEFLSKKLDCTRVVDPCITCDHEVMQIFIFLQGQMYNSSSDPSTGGRYKANNTTQNGGPYSRDRRAKSHYYGKDAIRNIVFYFINNI